MLNYQSYPQFNIVDNIQVLATSHLRTINWRSIKETLSQQTKDPQGTYIWWYSRTSKDNKVFHESNAECFLEDTEYSTGSGHFNIELNNSTISELNIFNSILTELDGLSYAGIFFIGPNSFVEEHVDKDMYNILINVKTPTDTFLTIDNKKFFLKENEVFMFDGDLKHSASNASNEDWILLALRINKKEFQI